MRNENARDATLSLRIGVNRNAAKETMASQPSIVFLDAATLGEPTGAVAVLAECHPCKFHDVTGPEDVAGRIAGHTIVVTNKVALSADVLGSAAAADLRLIAVAATGVDVVDLAAARERGIAVANVVGYSTRSVAEHTLALIFELAARVGRYEHAVREGAWERSPIFTVFRWPRLELAGKTIGIVGLGAIGQAVARIAAALGMEVLVASRPGSSDPPPPGRIPLDDLLPRVDVLTLHCPLTAATRALVNERSLGRMKRGAWLVNTARGGLVDEVALIAALRAGTLGGAALDVISREPPPPDHPILMAARELPYLVVTPHVAWTTSEARRRLADEIAENVHVFLRGESRNRVV